MGSPTGDMIKDFFREAKLQFFRGHTAQAEANIATRPMAKVAKFAGYALFGAAVTGGFSLLFGVPLTSTMTSGLIWSGIWYADERAKSHIAPHNRPLEPTKNPLKLTTRFFKDTFAQTFHARQLQTTEDNAMRPSAKIAKVLGLVGTGLFLTSGLGLVIGGGMTGLLTYFNLKATQENRIALGLNNPRNKKGGGGPKFRI